MRPIMKEVGSPSNLFEALVPIIRGGLNISSRVRCGYIWRLMQHDTVYFSILRRCYTPQSTGYSDTMLLVVYLTAISIECPSCYLVSATKTAAGNEISFEHTLTQVFVFSLPESLDDRAQGGIPRLRELEIRRL